MSANTKENLIDISESVGKIDSTDNRIITVDNLDNLPENLRTFNEKFFEVILDKNMNLTELEQKLRDNYSSKEILEIDGIRVANCIAWANTNLRRDVDKIILSNGDTPHLTKTNMGYTVIDPIGWASKVMAPSEGYGLLGKLKGIGISKEEIFDIMSSSVDLELKGLAIEYSELETAVMPVMQIEGANDLIESLSQVSQEGDISTAKHNLINL